MLTRQFLTKLEHYEQEKFKELNESVLDDAVASLDEGMKAMVNDLVGYTQKFTMLSQKKSQLTAAKEEHKGRPSKHGKPSNSRHPKHDAAAQISISHSSSQEVLLVPKPLAMAGGPPQAPSGQGALRASAARDTGGSHPYQSEADCAEETGAARSRSRGSGASGAAQSTHGSAVGTIQPSMQRAHDHSIASNSRQSDVSLAIQAANDFKVTEVDTHIHRLQAGSSGRVHVAEH